MLKCKYCQYKKPRQSKTAAIGCRSKHTTKKALVLTN